MNLLGHASTPQVNFITVPRKMNTKLQIERTENCLFDRLVSLQYVRRIIDMPTFQELWNNHPNIKGEDSLLDKKQYQNQCAVNLYAALLRSKTNVRSFSGQLSWQKGKPQYAIRAQELADWLARPGTLHCIKIEKFSGKEVFKKINGKRGIIFFQNYWGPGHQGDHIDLWNGNRLTDWKSWARINLFISWEGIWSDYRKAEAVWF